MVKCPTDAQQYGCVHTLATIAALAVLAYHAATRRPQTHRTAQHMTYDPFSHLAHPTRHRTNERSFSTVQGTTAN